MTLLQQHLRGMDEFFQEHSISGTLTESFVLRHGQPFSAGVRPSYIKQRPQKECFKNSLELALETGLTYVEGYTFRIIPILHAWCIDEDGTVLDPTLRDQEQLEYFGIPFNTDYVLEYAHQSGMYGVLDNYGLRRIGTDDPVIFIHPEWSTVK